MTYSMRTALQVPRRQRRALEALSRVDGDVIANLRTAMDEGGSTSSLADLRNRMHKALQSDYDNDPDLLLETLLGASNAKVWQGSSSEELAQLVAEIPDLEVETAAREKLGSHLSILLDSESLQTLAKGLDVLTEHDRVFLRSRMVTDIRPAYRNGSVDEPAAVVLVHTLRLDVQEDGRVKSIYISLDEQDLQQLQQTLDREQLKAIGLKRRFEASGLPILDFEDKPSPEEKP